MGWKRKIQVSKFKQQIRTVLKIWFDFRINETEAEMEARLSQWDQYLETADDSEQNSSKKEESIAQPLPDTVAQEVKTVEGKLFLKLT